jgi:hypothetical protein
MMKKQSQKRGVKKKKAATVLEQARGSLKQAGILLMQFYSPQSIIIYAANKIN